MPRPERVARWVVRAAVVVLVGAPAAAAIASPLQTGRAAIWVVAVLTGVVALSLLVVQVLLPTPWLRGVLFGRDLTVHRWLGISVAGLVLAHVVGLFVYSPDDIRDALLLAAPTYSRLGVLSACCVLLSVGLALARRRLGLTYSDWEILHTVLAVLIVATAVGHTVLIRGTLDGPAELVVSALAVIATSAAAFHRLVRRRASAGQPG